MRNQNGPSNKDSLTVKQISFGSKNQMTRKTKRQIFPGHAITLQPYNSVL